jgi:hypothetical protein
MFERLRNVGVAVSGDEEDSLVLARGNKGKAGRK